MDELEIVLFSIGNPGPVNRHSTGHYMLKKLMEEYGIRQLVNAPRSKYAISKSDNQALVFVKSNTYMNESNILFAQFMQQERIKSSALILVIYDDFELNLGLVRLQKPKKNESHNGLKSVQKCLGQFNDLNIYKLGIGIGPKPAGASSSTMALWVLSPMTLKEKAIIDDQALGLASAALEKLVAVEGNVGDLNKFNAQIKKMLACDSV